MDDAQYDVGMFLYTVQCYRSACGMKGSLAHQVKMEEYLKTEQHNI